MCPLMCYKNLNITEILAEFTKNNKTVYCIV